MGISQKFECRVWIPRKQDPEQEGTEINTFRRCQNFSENRELPKHKVSAEVLNLQYEHFDEHFASMPKPIPKCF